VLLQNLLGNDCAKARVNLCVTKDPSCLAFQNIIDVNGSSSAAAVGQVQPVLDQKCPVVEPSVPGVKVGSALLFWHACAELCCMLAGWNVAHKYL
jgi:hypothetical protein